MKCNYSHKNVDVVTNAAENTCGDLLTHFECNFPKSLFSQGTTTTTLRGSILLLPKHILHFFVFLLLVFFVEMLLSLCLHRVSPRTDVNTVYMML